MSLQTRVVQLTAIIPEEYAGLRLDQVLAKLFPDYSRARLQIWLKKQQITVNNQFLKAKDKVVGGESISINATLEAEQNWQAQAIDLDIIYEDDALLVINKPVGMVVHPAAGAKSNTLLNALLHHLPELNHIPRAGIIHRLDKDTSGLLVIAKTLTAHRYLVKELQNRDIHREYQAIVYGLFTAGGTVDAPIGRHPTQRTKMAVIQSGKAAKTHYRIIKKFRAHTHVKLLLDTGRTHQIRVHMAYLHHPIIGDQTYSGRLMIPKNASQQLIEVLRNFKRQALHAYRLELIHPITKEKMSWTAPLPQDMLNLLNCLQQEMDRQND